MVNNVIGVVNYVIAARPSLLNFMIADSHAGPDRAGLTLMSRDAQVGPLPIAAALLLVLSDDSARIRQPQDDDLLFYVTSYARCRTGMIGKTRPDTHAGRL
jgi:hypothetical protein